MQIPSYPPALGGLCSYSDGSRVGLSVDATVDRLRRYLYVKTQTFLLHAACFNGLPEWEVKGAISLHLWQDAEHCTWFRKRIVEMRTPPHYFDKVPDPALAAFFDELRQSTDSLEFLSGVYGVIKPALVAAFKNHLTVAHPIADQPTRRLLQFALQEEQEQLAWGDAALSATLQRMNLTASDPHFVEWQARLQRCLAAAGGIDGTSERSSTEIMRTPPRAGQPLSTMLTPKRDERFPHVWRSRGITPEPSRPIHERLWWMMNVRLNEMHVSELIARIITDWTGQPWEFYHDLARHLWDETRHCMLGEVSFASQGIDFTKIPTHIGFAEYPNHHLKPPERYAFLWGIEQGLMSRSGKQAEVELAKAGKDERAAVFQDFDWADEVLHAAIGRRWLEPHFKTREKMHETYERIRPAYDQMKDEDQKLQGRNWWPAFYAKFLKHLDTHINCPNEVVTTRSKNACQQS